MTAFILQVCVARLQLRNSGVGCGEGLFVIFARHPPTQARASWRVFMNPRFVVLIVAHFSYPSGAGAPARASSKRAHRTRPPPLFPSRHARTRSSVAARALRSDSAHCTTDGCT